MTFAGWSPDIATMSLFAGEGLKIKQAAEERETGEEDKGKRIKVTEEEQKVPDEAERVAKEEEQKAMKVAQVVRQE